MAAMSRLYRDEQTVNTKLICKVFSDTKGSQNTKLILRESQTCNTSEWISQPLIPTGPQALSKKFSFQKELLRFLIKSQYGLSILIFCIQRKLFSCNNCLFSLCKNLLRRPQRLVSAHYSERSRSNFWRCWPLSQQDLIHLFSRNLSRGRPGSPWLNSIRPPMPEERMDFSQNISWRWNLISRSTSKFFEKPQIFSLFLKLVPLKFFCQTFFLKTPEWNSGKLVY